MHVAAWNGHSSLLDAAQAARTQELLEAHGSTLTTDACDSGGYLRRRFSRGRPLRIAMTIPKPEQLNLWSQP